MFYIQKNDKPKKIEKIFNIIKMKENIIYIPVTKKTKIKQIEKLAQKTNKIINKYSNSKKIIISKKMLDEQIYINYLNSYGLEILDGKWLYEILATDIIEYIINKKQIQAEKTIVSILVNDLTDIELENIKILARKYKTLNIVTNHIEKFKKLEEKMLNEEGIAIIITNNKKTSLLKSQIILNVDFPQELINKYRINNEAIIINIKGKLQINSKRFNGLNINNYEIDLRDDRKDEKYITDEFYFKDLYEAKLYKKGSFKEIRTKLKLDKVVIKKLYLNNSEL